MYIFIFTIAWIWSTVTAWWIGHDYMLNPKTRKRGALLKLLSPFAVVLWILIIPLSLYGLYKGILKLCTSTWGLLKIIFSKKENENV
jgi:hypothetical protein